jgi:hypothetical protein
MYARHKFIVIFFETHKIPPAHSLPVRWHKYCKLTLRVDKKKFTNLRRCEIAQAGIGAIDGCLLHDAVASLAVAQVVRAQAVLSVKHTSKGVQ